ncbi:hypothetical protein O178_04380 [Chlamydia trachomatis]|nr:hypothetical protein O178_04380 [Chlamydia trachomatis]
MFVRKNDTIENPENPSPKAAFRTLFVYILFFIKSKQRFYS